MPSKKILAVSHNAFPGAPRSLIDACKALKRKGYEFHFLLLDAGPLLAEFQSLGRVDILTRFKVSGFFLQAALYEVKKKMLLERLKREWNPSLIYVNTVACSWLLGDLARMGPPIALHAHELEYVTAIFCDPHRPDFVRVPALYMAASRAVLNHLNFKYGIPAGKIELIYEGIDVQRINHSGTGRPPDRNADFILGGCGRCEWRKGTDLWVLLAYEIKKRSDKKIKFVWCGGEAPDFDKEGFPQEIAWSVQKLGLTGDVEFTGFLENPYPVFSQFDAFALTSREDPCPLAGLENMYLGKPVLCFSNSGGLPEILNEKTGIVIDGTDIPRMADAVLDLFHNSAKRKDLGEKARQKILQGFDSETVAENCHRLFSRFF